MRKSKVLAKWRENQFARFCAMGHVLPFFIQYAAHFNYDGIWLDLEHRNMDEREVQHLLALCHLFDIDCMVRPPTTMRTRLYRYLEDGAAGFMIPFVSDEETAVSIVNATKFPPIGNRGLDGAGLDCRYGIESWAPDSTFTADANRETFIVAQIETPEAVANAEAIAAVPGIDVLFVGPGDLGLRLEADPDNKMTMDECVAQVAAAAEKHGKVWGRTASSIDEVATYHAQGAKMVPWGGDFALMNVLREASEQMDSKPGL
ncbi:MAG: aldolase/citrate lyase family protein [Chloroflexota bacterium]